MADVVSFKPDSDVEKTPRDRALASLAAVQHGVVEHGQLIGLGFRRGGIQLRVGNGRLHPLYPRVYAVGHPRVSLTGHWMGAVLSCGTGSLLSHHAAGGHLGLRPTSRITIDVTAPGRSRRSRRGVAVHCVRRLHPEDCARVDNIPVTSVSRTLLDLAEVLQPHQLARAVEAAERQHLFDRWRFSA